MPTPYSLNFRSAAMAQDTEVVSIVLLVISHADIDGGPIRLSSDPTERITTDPLVYGTRSNGAVYDYCGMSIMIPDKPEEALAGTTLTLDNVNQLFGPVVGEVRTPATVDILIVTSEDTDIVEDSWPGMESGLMTVNASTLRVEIAYPSISQEPFPSAKMSKSRFPGMFE